MLNFQNNKISHLNRGNTSVELHAFCFFSELQALLKIVLQLSDYNDLITIFALKQRIQYTHLKRSLI